MVVEVSDHGRTVPEIQDALGMFVGALPLRARVDGEASAVLLVETVRSGLMEAMVHREVPVCLLAERLQAEPPAGRSRLADVAVSYMNFGDSIEAGATEWDIRPLRANLRGSSVADLKFFVTERGSSMEVLIEYDSDLFRPGTAERFGDLLLSIMEGMAVDPATKVGKLGGTS
jgi:non-ribosomal peptide synthetase component F